MHAPIHPPIHPSFHPYSPDECNSNMHKHVASVVKMDGVVLSGAKTSAGAGAPSAVFERHPQDIGIEYCAHCPLVN